MRRFFLPFNIGCTHYVFFPNVRTLLQRRDCASSQVCFQKWMLYLDVKMLNEDCMIRHSVLEKNPISKAGHYNLVILVCFQCLAVLYWFSFKCECEFWGWSFFALKKKKQKKGHCSNPSVCPAFWQSILLIRPCLRYNITTIWFQSLCIIQDHHWKGLYLQHSDSELKGCTLGPESNLLD